MPNPIEDIEQLKDIKIGELNDISFDLEDPLVTNEYDGKSLMSNMISAFLGRESAFDKKRPHKGIVLLSSKVQTLGITGIKNSLVNSALELTSINKVRNFAIVRVPEIHGHIPTPSMQALIEVAEDSYEPSKRNLITNTADLSERDKLLLSMHDPYFSSPIGAGNMRHLKPGDIVLLDGDGFIIELVEPAEVSFLGSIYQSAVSNLNWLAGRRLGGNVLGELNQQAINSEQTGVIIGDDLSQVTSAVQTEQAFWNGVVETDSIAYSRLQAYWSLIPSATFWSPAGTPWSAAYISYILNQAGSGLTPVSAHYLYVKQASEGIAGYGIIDTTDRSSRIRANIGDILVKPRGGTTETHGDIVYSISENRALLSGGNVGSDTPGQQTVKSGDSEVTGRILKLDEEGNYQSFGPYTTLVKRNPRFI